MKKFHTEVHLAREMSLLDATMIGVGAMIGAGIFVLTGIAAGVAGPGLIIAFALNGFVALLTAMSYAELGSCFHDAGGGYLWVKEGLPKWNGFLSGWMSWFAHAVACSLYALGFGAYFEHVLVELGVMLPEWGFLSSQKILAIIIAVIFAYINFRGASETGKVGNFVTMLKIVILAVFIGFGIELMVHRGNWEESFTPFLPNGWGGVIQAMGLTFIAFQGFEVISQASEEIKNPKKNIPRAVFLSLAIVVPIYLLVAFVSLGTIQPEGMTPWDYLASQKETALVGVAQTFFAGGGVLLLFGGVISTMSALNATIYSSSRVAFAMGRDRNFPTFFAKVHSKKFTPHLAILFSLGIVVLMSATLHIEDVAAAADIMFLLLFLQVNITLIRLRKKRPDLDRGFVTPFLPYLTIVGIALLLFLAVYMFNYSPLGWLVTALWIGIGLLIYKGYASEREVEHVQKVKALERLERKDYSILVPISKRSSIKNLLTIAMAVAKKNNAEIILLHVIEVREGQPLRAGLQESDRASELLEEAEEYVESSGVPVREIVRVAHRISEGILQTAVVENCNFIILGRAKKPTFMKQFFSSAIDSVLQEAPCEVAVIHGTISRKDIKNIVIPFGGDIHTQLALEIAPALVDYFKAKARVALVLEPELSNEVHSASTAKAQEMIAQNKLNAQLTIVRNKNILPGILQQSRHADLLVMGGRSGDFLELLFGQSLAQEITEQVPCPVLWIKEYHEPESFWRSLLKPQTKEAEETHG